MPGSSSGTLLVVVQGAVGGQLAAPYYTEKGLTMGCKVCRYLGWIANPKTRQADPCPECGGRAAPGMPMHEDTILYPTLRKYVRETSPESYLEIGTREGASLATVIVADTDRHIKRLAIVDPWGGDFGGSGRGNHLHIERLLADLKYTGEALFYDDYSRHVLKKVRGCFDLILVDGDHSAPGCLFDMTTSIEKLCVGGLMIIDDVTHPEHSYLMDVVEKFCLEHSDITMIYASTEYSGVAVLQKNKKVESVKNV